MITKLLQGFCVLFALILLTSTNMKAQINTTTFNDNLIKQNSIVVKYNNVMIKANGKSVLPQVLVADVRTQFNASIEKILKSGTEEWSLTSDMATILDKLNRIPGVRAFPNYVFQRPDVEITPFESNTSGNGPTDLGRFYDYLPSTTESSIKNIPVKEFEYAPQALKNKPHLFSGGVFLFYKSYHTIE